MPPDEIRQLDALKASSDDAGFRRDLVTLINRYSRENGSDTPDFILADYLVGCLANWDAAVSAREKWYGRENISVLTGLPCPPSPTPDRGDER